jgi:esterase/lipase
MPVLILQGERDCIVKPEGARLLYGSLNTKEKQLIMLDADHDIFGLFLPSNILSEKALEVIEIIQKWLISVSIG